MLINSAEAVYLPRGGKSRPMKKPTNYPTTMKQLKTATDIVSLCVIGLLTGQASALSLTLIDGSVGAVAAGNTLTAAVQAPASGINVDGSSIIYQGTAIQGQTQAATYTGFSLAPSSGSTPTLNLGDGIFLTSGSANIPPTNTTNSFSNALLQPGSGSNLLLTTLSGFNTNDANALSFDFTVDPGVTSVSANFIFGTDEFPTQSVTDIFGFFVDGVNYAKFSSGELISNTPGNPTNFISNPVGSGLYSIEYNGLTKAFNVVGILDSGLTTHTLTIGVADTSDSIWDSGVFIGGLKAGTATGGGGIGTTPDGGTTLILLGGALAGIAGLRRRLA